MAQPEALVDCLSSATAFCALMRETQHGTDLHESDNVVSPTIFAQTVRQCVWFQDQLGFRLILLL